MATSTIWLPIADKGGPYQSQGNGKSYVLHAFYEANTGRFMVVAVEGNTPLVQYSADGAVARDMFRLGMNALDELIKAAKGDIDAGDDGVFGLRTWST